MTKRSRFCPGFAVFPVCVFLLFLGLPLALSQGPPAPPGLLSGIRNAETGISSGVYRNLFIKVLSDTNTKLDRQAVVKLYDKKRNQTVWETTSGDSDVLFQDVDFGDYDIEVSAVGYVTQRKELHVTATIDKLNEDVILQKDPTAIDLKLADEGLPPNARRDAARALFLLKSSKFSEAQKKLERVYTVAPTNAQINFLLGFLYLQLKDQDKAESFFNQSANLDPRRVQTWTLLGRVQLTKEHYEDARKSLERAVEVDSTYWMAHNLLADAYLKLKDYEKARQQAQLAFDQGKGEASVALLPLGQALANLGRDEEALHVLQNFIQANPADPTVPLVKDFIAKVETRDKTLATEIRPSADLVLQASQPSLPPSAWGPPGVDDIKPQIATGVSCPYDEVIEKSGERVKRLVDSISQFAATEDLLHEQLDPSGNPLTKETRKFDYVASIKEPQPGFLSTDEYRNTKYGLDELPDRIVSSGFMSLALIFHPDMRENYQITCEGLGDWHGQATWVMYFRQRADKPSRLADLVVGGQTYPIDMKGRAWITADKFEIVRIESELIKSLPLLAVQHQIAEYGPIHFARGNIDLWLPKSVDIYFELNRHRYYRRHSFDHYMLFAINSEEKQGSPKDPAPQTQKQNR
jgi:tetratricopeptide (TPR) repeat protein